jgi:hypothetical protein
MPWSIFSDGGGPGAAATWAVDLLRKIGAPITTGNQQFVYDWETSEGGGGKYNPLNQGPVPGDSTLTSTGSQYGGGAADYVSWPAGLTGAADYLDMPAYQGIRDSLRADRPAQARADLITSPWAASHYGGGSAFSDAPLPGHRSALSPTSSDNSASSTAPAASGGLLGGLTDTLKTLGILVPAVVAGAGLVVWGLGRMTGARSKIENAAGTAAKAGALAV